MKCLSSDNLVKMAGRFKVNQPVRPVKGKKNGGDTPTITHLTVTLNLMYSGISCAPEGEYLEKRCALRTTCCVKFCW